MSREAGEGAAGATAGGSGFAGRRGGGVGSGGVGEQLAPDNGEGVSVTCLLWAWGLRGRP